MSGWYRVYSRFYKIARGFYRLQKTSAVFYSCRQTCVQVLCHELPYPFFLYKYTLLQLNQYNRLFLSFCIVIWGTFLFPRPTFYFFRESFSFFISTKLIPWYKSFFWFLCIKALLSPPLLGRQPNLFVKRPLNLDSYLFSCAWKFLSTSFVLSPFASTFIFCFAWKILSIRRIPYAVGRQRRVFLLLCRLNHQYFLCVKISLCSRFSPVIYYRFIVAASIYIILFLFRFLFIFSWKLLLFYI